MLTRTNSQGTGTTVREAAAIHQIASKNIEAEVIPMIVTIDTEAAVEATLLIVSTDDIVARAEAIPVIKSTNIEVEVAVSHRIAKSTTNITSMRNLVLCAARSTKRRTRKQQKRKKKRSHD